MALTEKELNDFKKSLEKMSEKSLLDLEQKIIAEIDEINKNVAETQFDLPEENWAVVAESIRYFLNKQTVQWQYALAMVGMFDFWDPEKYQKQIPYPQLDVILRQLGGLQFTGYEEWSKVVIINKYFEPLREKYVEVTQQIYDIASKHNAITDQLALKKPVQK